MPVIRILEHIGRRRHGCVDATARPGVDLVARARAEERLVAASHVDAWRFQRERCSLRPRRQRVVDSALVIQSLSAFGWRQAARHDRMEHYPPSLPIPHGYPHNSPRLPRVSIACDRTAISTHCFAREGDLLTEMSMCWPCRPNRSYTPQRAEAATMSAWKPQASSASFTGGRPVSRRAQYSAFAKHGSDPRHCAPPVTATVVRTHARARFSASWPGVSPFLADPRPHSSISTSADATAERPALIATLDGWPRPRKSSRELHRGVRTRALYFLEHFHRRPIFPTIHRSGSDLPRLACGRTAAKRNPEQQAGSHLRAIPRARPCSSSARTPRHDARSRARFLTHFAFRACEARDLRRAGSDRRGRRWWRSRNSPGPASVLSAPRAPFFDHAVQRIVGSLRAPTTVVVLLAAVHPRPVSRPCNRHLAPSHALHVPRHAAPARGSPAPRADLLQHRSAGDAIQRGASSASRVPNAREPARRVAVYSTLLGRPCARGRSATALGHPEFRRAARPRSHTPLRGVAVRGTHTASRNRAHLPATVRR